MPVAVRQPSPARQFPEALALQKPAVMGTLGILTWRGANTDGEKFLNDIAPALDLYRADKYADAAARLESLSSQYKNSVEVFFYLGVSRLFLGEFSSAGVALERAARLADESFSAEVSWYLALAYQRSGRTPEAAALLSRLCSTPNAFRDKACAAFKELEGGAGAQPRKSPTPEPRK